MNAYQEYENFKEKFKKEHPDATPEEYQEAMKEKARELGI